MNQDDIQFIRDSLSKRWRFWLYFWRIPRLLSVMCDEMERMWAEEDRILKERNDSVKANKSLLQWVHVTHRLSTTPEAIRALFAAGKRLRIILFFAFASAVFAAPPPPLVRNYLTTNQTFLQVGALTNNGADGFGWFNLTNITSGGSSSMTNALLWAGPTNGSVSPLILTAGTGITITTSGTNRIAAIDTNVVAEISDLVWTNDGSAVMIASDTNRVRHFTNQTVFYNGVFDTGAFVAITNTGVMAITPRDSPGCYGKVSSGMAGAFFYFATNCFVSADDGAWAGGFFDGHNNGGCSNSFAIAFDGGHAGGLFDYSHDTFIRANEGSLAGGYYSIVRNCYIWGNEGSISIGEILESSNCFIRSISGGYASGEIGALNTATTTNSSIYASSGIAIGVLPVSNESIRAQGDSVGTLAIGRDVVSTNNWTVGIHGTNSTDFSLGLVNNGVKFLVESNGAVTSDSLTASTVLQSSSAKKITSVANGTGALTNNGSGTLGWYDLTTLAPATGGAYIATNNGRGWNTTLYAATNSSISTDKVSLTVQGIANQTGDLQQWLSSSGTTNAWMASNGVLFLPINSSAPSIGMATSSGNGIGLTSSSTIDFYLSGALRTRFSGGAVYLNNAAFGIGSSAGNPTVSFYRLGDARGAIGTGVDSGFAALTVSNLQVVGSALITNALAVGGGLNFSRFATNANVSMSTNFYVWAVTSVAVLVTNTLPSASTSQGIHFIIKDEGGNAGTTNITVAVQSGDAIDSATTYTINANFGSKQFYSAGSTNWFTY